MLDVNIKIKINSMGKKSCLCVVLAAVLVFSSLLTSCSSYEEEYYYVRDTVVVKKDTIIREERPVEPLRLKLVIQIASFSNQKSAEDFSIQVKEKLNSYPDIRTIQGMYVVTVGSYNNNNQAEEYLNFVKARGFNNAFIKNLD